jgi:hypothetical protein
MNTAKIIIKSVKKVLCESANVFLDYSGDSLVLEFDTDFNLQKVKKDKAIQNILSNFKVIQNDRKLYLSEPGGEQFSHNDYQLIKKSLENLNLWVN